MHVTKIQIAGLLLSSVLLGVASSTGCTLYHRHSAQHWTAEQALQRQDQINRELIAAINALAARSPK